MGYIENLQSWLDSPYVQEAVKQEICRITDKKEQAEAFGQELAFGTGGMRGIMGPGNNRINYYTLGRAIRGLAQWLHQEENQAAGNPSETKAAEAAKSAKTVAGATATKKVVVAFDTRHNSWEYGKLAAMILAGEGIKACLFEEPTPTPVLSYAVRQLKADAGLVITASHNMKEYNGVKVYNAAGCQLVPKEAEPLMAQIRELPLLFPLPEEDWEALVAEDKIRLLKDEVPQQFLRQIENQALLEDKDIKEALSIVYTPLHGAGNLYVRQALAAAGFSQVKAVTEQEYPDGDFPTVLQPNPEDTRALVMAMELALKSKAHVVLGTDPDSDRLGAAVFHEGNFKNLTGNQIGVLLADYLLTRKKALDSLPSQGVFINTIVTSTLGERIAEAYGLKIIKTLTGFKYIGEQMNSLAEQTPGAEKGTFIFGYEESNGFLVGDYARDKDAIGAALLFCEAAAYWLARGKTLVDRLEELYQAYGYYLDALDTFTFRGREGQMKMDGFMDSLRQSGGTVLPAVAAVEDYSLGLYGLPKENVLRFVLEEETWVAVRPSGTEPKLKIYYSVAGKDRNQALARQEQLKKIMHELIEK